MIIQTLPARIILIIICLNSTSSWAIDYIVDVILFENLSTQSTSLDSTELYYPVTEDALSLGTIESEEAGFLIVEPTQEIQRLADRLESSSRYHLIQHITWQQPGLAVEDARAIQISLGEEIILYLPTNYSKDAILIKASNPDPYEVLEVSDNLFERPPALKTVSSTQLAGTLTVSLGRYLHMDTNLVLTRANNSGSARMKISRRMRSREVHYLDNPDIGLLVLITPVEEPEEQQQQVEEIITEEIPGNSEEKPDTGESNSPPNLSN